MKVAKTRKQNIATACFMALAIGCLASFGAAAQVDVSAATGALTEAETAVTTIGPLMLAVLGGGIVFKWVAAFLI